MSHDVILRQGTFETDPSDRLVSNGDSVSLSRGGFELPIIDDDGTRRHEPPRKSQYSRTTNKKDKNRQYKQSPYKEEYDKTPSPKKQPKTMSGDNYNKESYESLVSERNSLLRSDTVYKKRIKQLEDEANDFLQTIDRLSSENKDLRNATDKNGSNSRSVKNGKLPKNSENERIISDLRTENKFLLQQLHDERKQNEKLLGSMQELEKDANDNKVKSKNIASDDKKANAEKLKLLEDLKKTKEENKDLFEQNVRLKDENYGNVKKMHAYERDVEKLKSDVNDIENKKFVIIRDLENRNAFLNSDKKDLKAENASLEQQLKTSEQKLRDLKKRRDEDAVKISDLNKAIEQKAKIESENDESKREAERYKRKLTEMTTYYDDLQSQHETLKGSEKKLKDVNAKHIEDLGRNRKSADRKEREYRIAKENLERVETEFNDLKVSGEKNTNLLAEQRSLTKKQSTEIHKLKSQNEKLSKDLNSVLEERNKLKEMCSDVDLLRSDLDKSKDKVKQMKQNHEAAVKKLTEEHKEELYSQADKFMEEKRIFDEKCEETEELRSKLETGSFENSMKVKSLSDKLKNLEVEKFKLSKEFSELEVNHKKVVLENAHFRKLLGMDSNTKNKNQTEAVQNVGNKQPRTSPNKNKSTKSRKAASLDVEEVRRASQKSSELILPSITDSESSRDPTPESKASSTSDAIRPVNFGTSYSRLHKKKLEFQHR